MHTGVKLSIMLILGVFLVTGRASGQTKLSDILSYALEHSSDIKKSNLQVEEAGYMRKEVMAQGLPQVEATGNYSKMGLPDISISPEMGQIIPQDLMPLLQQLSKVGALYTASAGVQVTQLLYSQAWLEGLKTAKKTGELYNLLRNKPREDIIEEVAKTSRRRLPLHKGRLTGLPYQ